MSKEVEAAVKRIRNTIAYLGRKSGKTRYFEDINLIIEQAEQFQELEDRHYRQELIDEHIERLEKQNKRYRESLENIRSVKGDENFDNYAYMMLEIIEWAEEALKESAE